MACMEYKCLVCDWFEMSNKNRKVCPHCGSKIHSVFDELPSIDNSDDMQEEPDFSSLVIEE